MYAAAGGASLASRQARQRQRQNKKTQQKPKATNLPTKQPQQFPNYTDQAIVLPPRLSRVERNALRPPTQSGDRRHSTSNYHLRASAGADTQSSGHQHGAQHRRLRESPSICIPMQQHHHQRHLRAAHQHLRQPSHLDLSSQLGGTQGSTLQLPQVHHLLPPQVGTPLERRCSFVRQVEEMERPQKEAGILDRCNHMCNFEVKPIGGDELGEVEQALLLSAAQSGGGMGEYERGAFGGSTDYPFSECSQGRAAWVERERGRRCSVSEEAARQQRLKQSEAHHRWMKRNRIHDTGYGGSSDGYDDDYSPSTIAYHQSAAANALLYVGLGTAAIGAIIFIVGTGEKGFKTLELRLIGPTLVACGLLCCLVRILLCACPSTCLHNRRKRRKKEMEMETTCCQHSISGHRTAGSAIAGAAAAMLPRPPSIHQQQKHRGNSREKNDMLLSSEQQLRSKKKVCITTAAPTAAPPSAAAQAGTSTCSDANREQQQQVQLIIPTISEPPPPSQDIVELVPLDVVTTGPTSALPPASTCCFFDMEYELQSVSDDDDDDYDNDCEGETVIEVELPKHSRTREPCNSSVSAQVTESRVTTSVPASQPAVTVPVTTVSVISDCNVVPRQQQQQQHSGIVLSPSQLQTKQ